MPDRRLLQPGLSFKPTREDNSWDRGPGNPLVWRFAQSGSNWRPPTDVYETDDHIIVMVEIAGMRGVDIQVTYDEKVLHIRGNRQCKSSARAFHQMEIPYGDFLVGIRISAAVDPKAIEAGYNDGFLKVELPRLKPYRIEINE